MGKHKQYFFSLSFLLSIPIIHTFYNLLNNDQRGAYILNTKIDDMIPFIDIFIVPYVIWYPFIFITLAYIAWKDKPLYIKTLVTMNIAMLTCYMIYFVFQTHVPRPELTGNSVFTKMVEWIYINDAPFNAFPSIHSLTSFLMLYAVQRSNKINLTVKNSVSIIAILIIISTLFVKQHVILDAISAIMLGYIIFNGIEGVFSLKQLILWKKSKSRIVPSSQKQELSRIGNR
jgi:membrane-associated phospholipid phosphatase